MKRTIALLGASALLVVGTAFAVQAQTAGGILPCADLIEGGGSYTPPNPGDLLNPPTAGKLTWIMELAGASCPDVQYGVTVFLNGTDGEAAPILGSASTAGDTVSDTFTFQLEINTSNDGEVCVVQTTVGGSGAPTSSKNGAAFDADGSGSSLLDRGPDGPTGGDVTSEPDIYCIPVPDPTGRSAG